MRIGLSSRTPRLTGEHGYVLLSLLLLIAVLMIAATAATSNLTMQIQRDREEELIHRAMQYRRAVRQYAKATGRFPMSLDQLENTNGIRFLRRRYKDPITGKDFRILHMADVPAAMGKSSNAWSLQASANENQPVTGSDDEVNDPSAEVTATQMTDASQNASAPDGNQNAAPPDPGPSSQHVRTTSGLATQPAALPAPGNATFGGGVIIGVASRSAKKTIREFNQKNRYNQWLFFYDPGFDRGFEVHGPTPLVRLPAPLNPAAPLPSMAAAPGMQTQPAPATSPNPTQQ